MNSIIKQVEYKGVQFDVEVSSSVQITGEDAFHVPLRSGKRYYEPISVGLVDFELTFVIVSQEVDVYESRRKLLLDLLKEGRVGEIIHPFFGRLAVAVDRKSITIKESMEQLGVCKVSAQFKEVTFKLPPKAKVVKPAAVITPGELIEEVKAANKSLMDRIKDLKIYKAMLRLLALARLKLLALLKALGPLLSKIGAVLSVVAAVQAKVMGAISKLNRLIAKGVMFQAALKGKANALKTSVKSLTSIASSLMASLESHSGMPPSTPSIFGKDLPEENYLFVTNNTIDSQARFINASVEATFENTEELGGLTPVVGDPALVAMTRVESMVKDLMLIDSMTKVDPAVAVIPTQDFSVELSERINTLNTEFLIAYTALKYVDMVNEVEFTTMADVIRTVDTLYNVANVINDCEELPASTKARFKAYIDYTTTAVYNSLDDVKTITNVPSKGLPLRALTYRLYGSTDQMQTIYQINGEWFDLGETPDLVSILE